MFKLPEILDYPADVTYEGGIPYSEESFQLDAKTIFKVSAPHLNKMNGSSIGFDSKKIIRSVTDFSAQISFSSYT